MAYNKQEVITESLIQEKQDILSSTYRHLHEYVHPEAFRLVAEEMLSEIIVEGVVDKRVERMIKSASYKADGSGNVLRDEDVTLAFEIMKDKVDGNINLLENSVIRPAFREVHERNKGLYGYTESWVDSVLDKWSDSKGQLVFNFWKVFESCIPESYDDSERLTIKNGLIHIFYKNTTKNLHQIREIFENMIDLMRMVKAEERLGETVERLDSTAKKLATMTAEIKFRELYPKAKDWEVELFYLHLEDPEEIPKNFTDDPKASYQNVRNRIKKFREYGIAEIYEKVYLEETQNT